MRPGVASILMLVAPAHTVLPGTPRRAILTRGAAVAAAGVLGLDAYMRAPLPLQSGSGDPWEVLQRLLPATQPEMLVLVFPGAGGSDANSAAVVNAVRRARRGSSVVEVDLHRWLGGELRGAGNARRIGATLGQRLAEWASEPPAATGGLRSLHLIGISVGGQAADAACSAFADGCGRRPDAPHRRLTLLDPFTASGLLGLVAAPRAYGVLRFGASPVATLRTLLLCCAPPFFTVAGSLHPSNPVPLPSGERADYVEAVINTDDPVPSTGLPLRRAVTYDVTAAAARTRFSPLPGDSLHSWPAAWYGANAAALLSRTGSTPVHAAGGLERGAVVMVP